MASLPMQTSGMYIVHKEYIKSWSNQLLINYILTLYENLVKLGVQCKFCTVFKMLRFVL